MSTRATKGPEKAGSRRTAGPAKPRPAPRAKASPAPFRPEKREVRIFVSYSHVDRDVRRRLETHLAPLRADNVSTWFDGDMEAGDRLDTGIARALRRAHVFVALISSDYLDSRYCWTVEYRRAMNRRARGTMRVVAVVVRPCLWKATVAAGFKLLPEDGRTLQEWRSVDAALTDVVAGIQRVVASVRKGLIEAPAEPRRKPAVAPAARTRAGDGGPKTGKSVGGKRRTKPAGAAPAKPAGARTTAGKRPTRVPPARGPRR